MSTVKRLKSALRVRGSVADRDGGPKEELERRLGERGLRDRMERLRRETGGLLDGRALLALVADEEGLVETRLSKLSDLDRSRPVFTRCVVEEVGPVREYQGRDRSGRLRKLRVADETGELALTLWDEETALVEQLGLRRGTPVRILGAILRETRFGPEIQVGRTGFIVPQGDLAPKGPSRPGDPGDLRDEPGRVDVRGVILSCSTSGRGPQKVTTLRLFDGTGESIAVVPNEELAPPPDLTPGVEIELTGARAERAGGNTIFRCDRRSALRII